jgi:protein-tyrosine-phosphatase
MRGLSRLISAMLVAGFLPLTAAAQDLPAEYQAVLTSLNKKGDFKDGVFKVNIPRNDLTVKIGNRTAPTPFGFGGWVALTPGDGMQVMMGDLVLTEDEVNPVMSAILANGLSVTALHNHFFWEQPRVFYMHVHGMGSTADLARKLKPAIALIDAAAARATAPAPAAGTAPAGVTAATVAKIIGTQGELTGPVYKITIGRPDIDLREHGAKINARMGLNTWAAFAGSDTDAMVAGDVAMLESEVQPVLKALRAHGIDIVAIHHHMTDVKPTVIFLHYFGTGPATKLAEGVRAAVDLLGKARPSGLDPTAATGSSGQGSVTPARTGKTPTVLFMCPHGAAKSVLASAYFQRLARERGLNVRVESAGTEPDPEVSPAVAAHLVKSGYPIPVDKPRKVTASDLATADVVISMGCDLKGVPVPRGTLLKWDEVPGPGENFAAADAAIRKRVLELVEDLMGQPRPR